MDDEPRSPTPRDEADDDPHPPNHHAQHPGTFELLDPDALLPHDDRTELDRLLRAAAEHLGAPGSVRVRVVDDQRMTAEHERHSGLATTTDVLTFDLADNPETLDADLFVCADVAQRAADARGTSRVLELLLYAVHGALHCLGHDDQTPQAFKAMHTREDDILTAIGAGPVFSTQTQTNEPTDEHTEPDP